MNRPYLKNHVALKPVKNMADLFRVFKGRVSIYFRPLDRVMPIKFFTGWSWGLENLQRHIDLGSFYEVERRDRMLKFRINDKLADCPKVIDGKLVFSKKSLGLVDIKEAAV